MIYIFVISGIIFLSVVAYIIIKSKRKRTIQLTADELNLLRRKKFDNYELSSFLAHEDFNSTFRAYDTENNKDVFIGILHPELINDNTFVKQFLFKAEKLKYLIERFPGNLFPHNIHFGTADIDDKPRPYIVTDYIQGVTLAEVLEKQNLLSPRDAIEIISQVAKAVSAAHSERIILRDFSPTNVTLSLDESKNLVATLADIGAPFENLPSEAIIQNRQGYYSPEEKHGNAVSEQSDIYSLAALLFRMLEGFDPSHRNGNPDTDLTSLFINALSENPSKRPSSVEKFLESIGSLSKVKSNIRNVRWSELIPQMLKVRESVKLKLPGQKPISVHYEKKYADIPLVKPPKLPSSVVTGLVTAFFLWTGKKVESVLSSPKKAFKFFLIGLASIVAFIFVIWYFFFSPDATTIVVKTEPHGAILYVNGASKGNTPSAALTVDTGEVIVKVSKEGFFDYVDTFNISQEQNLEKIFKLIPSGKLSITVNPPDATVVVDTDTIPNFKRSGFELSVGKYIVFVTHKIFKAQKYEIEIQQGKTTDLSVDLNPTGGPAEIEIVIDSSPSDAELFIDDMERSIGPTRYEGKITPGKHRIKIVKGEKNVDYDEWINISPNQKPLNLTLKPAGLLRLISKDVVKIVVGGKDELPKSPSNEYKIAKGSHRIKLYNNDFKTIEKLITITPEKPSEWKPNFEIKYSITIQAVDESTNETIMDAIIYVDGKQAGKKTTATIPVGEGYRNIYVFKEGYKLVGGPKEKYFETDITETLIFKLKKN